MAKLIMDENPEVFDTLEQARSAVRYVRGTCGAVKRDQAKEIVLSGPRGKHAPKILIFDIETSPMQSWHWRTYKENINPVQVIQYSEVLCWAAKWLDSPTVLFDSKQHDEDDKRICETLWKLCDEADILVAHNGQAFDLGFMRTRWLKHKIAPPSPYKIVDTLKIVRKQFGFPNNKLETLVRYLELGQKLEHHGFQLWIDCMAGDKEAWKLMEEYNIRDVLILESFYREIRTWDTRHPNVALLYDDDEERCVCCGHTTFKKLAKSAYTSVSMFLAKRCENCGKIMRVGSRDKLTKKVLRNVI